MNTIPLILIALAAGGAARAAAPSTAELMAAPRAFMDALGAGKIDAAAAAMTSDASIIDEFTPFTWSGSGAFHRWLDAYGAWTKAAHTTNNNVKLGDPIYVQAEGDTAYVVAAASETYRQDGKRIAETARMTFALRREGGSWKIASWAWAARAPHEAGAGAAKKPT